MCERDVCGLCWIGFGYVDVPVCYDALNAAVYCCVCYVGTSFVFPVWWFDCVYLLACEGCGFVVLVWRFGWLSLLVLFGLTGFVDLGCD